MSEPTPEELSRTLEKMRLANRRLANYRKGITSLAPLVGKIPGNVWEKLGAAEAKVEELERDNARLDFWIAHKNLYGSLIHWNPDGYWVGFEQPIKGPFPSFREAIDAAMSEEPRK